MSDGQRIDDMREDISKLFELMSTMQQAVVRIETKMDATPRCPDPGACVRVERGMQDYGVRIHALEKAEDKRTGFLAAVSVLSTLLGGAIAMLVNWISGRH